MSTQGHEKEAVNVEGLKAALKSSGNKAIYNEAICSTAGGTAAKVTNTVPPSFSLVSGAKILVKFTYAITVANATLQIGTNAAKPIFYHGAALAANLVKAGTLLLLTYDGTNFNVVGDINTDTTYQVMGASGANHASGLVPDTPSVAGTTKFLREDGTWQEVNASPEVQLGGNTPSSESDIKLFVDESADDTVEVYTKAQADGQFVATVNMNTEPTESTLTYTATDGTTKNFKVGDEIRVPDAEADNGYTFYKLYALTTEEGVTTATWDKIGAGGGATAGLEIVAASGTTLNAEVGKYYRYDNDVTNLAVTLPTITGATEVQEIKLYFNTTNSPNISFTSSEHVIYGYDFEIAIKSLQECTIIYNGSDWVLSNKIIKDNTLLLNLGKTLTDESVYNWTTTTTGTVTPNYNNEGILLGGASSLNLDTGIKDIILNKDFSVSLDVKLVGVHSNNACLISMGGSNGAGGAAYFILENSVISLVLYYASGERIKQNFSGSLNTWYRYEFRKQEGRSYILIDGIILGSSDYTNTNNAGNFVIGANQSALGESINGIVRNVKIKLL